MLVQTASQPQHTHPGPSRLVPEGMMAPFVQVTALFFLWGLPNNLNDVLIRQFMKSFQLTRFQAGLIQSALYCGYFVLATPAALMMRRFGYKSGMIAGLCLLGTGTFLFWPAALVDKPRLLKRIPGAPERYGEESANHRSRGDAGKLCSGFGCSAGLAKSHCATSRGNPGLW